MMVARHKIRPRSPVFVGCEGESERAYAQLLNSILVEQGFALHFEVVNLNPGAGDPVSRLRRARKEIERREVRRSKFIFNLIIMDSDQIENDPTRRDAAERLADELGITIIWQNPCHEAFLLRHLPRCHDKRPSNTNLSMDALRSVWPEYRKPMSKLELSRRIDFEQIKQAMSVEKDLAVFLSKLGITI